MGIASDITALIGSTPCVRLNRLTLENGCSAEVVAKLECFNPSASVKDRIASAMVLEAEAQGTIHLGRTVLEELTSSRDYFLVDPFHWNFMLGVKRYRSRQMTFDHPKNCPQNGPQNRLRPCK